MVKKEITKTEYQRMEEDLEDLEMYIKEFSSFLPLAVCAINPPEFIIDINQAFQNLTGYSPAEIIGEPLNKIFLEKKEIGDLLKATQKKRTVRTRELTIISKGKKEIPVDASVSMRRDSAGNYIGCFLALFDITEIKRSREELEGKVKERTEELEKRTIEVEDSRKALMNILKDVDDSKKALVNILEDVGEARNRAEEEKNKTLTIINNFADGLFVFDRENKLSLINPQGEAFFDVKKRDLFGRSVLGLNTFPTLGPLIKLLGKEIKGVFRKELPIRDNLTLEVSTIPMTFGEEKLSTLVILHDITREKIIERMKTEFVSLSAHQLRTPLAAIKWTLRMLLDGDLGPITKEQREFVEKTYSSNERMIALINDLLDITRIEEGRYLYRPILTEIEPIVQFVINSCKEKIERKKIIFDFKKSEEKLPKVMIDVEKIRLAIQNLLDNALSYTLSGGRVMIAVRRIEKEIEFSVKDSGIGIPKDQQVRIFTKFFRGANVLRMETDGSGLGLFITKNIIEAHGGRVWFESKEGEGTTFYFTLPIREEFEGFLKEF